MKACAPKKQKVTKQAICDPIVLREGPHVRLTFVPELVDDPANPKAKVDGYFAYERKSAGQPWREIQSSLSTLRADEGVKLQIDHLELLALLERLVPLYKFYEIPNSSALGKSARTSTHASASPEKVTCDRVDSDENPESLLTKVADWLATEQGREAAGRLYSDSPEQVPTLTAALGLASLRVAYDDWTKNQANSSETFWQQTLEGRAYVLSQLFA